MSSENPKSILICGESGHGKSASLLGIKDRTDVLYLNCEQGKPLPFKNKFKKKTITDPEDVIDYIEQLAAMEADPEENGKNPFKFVVVDTISFMMDMYERAHVTGSANTQKAWGNYGQFFPRLMDATAKLEDTFFIFLGHLDSHLDEDEGMMKHSVPVKGALAKKGLEAYFTTVVYVKRMRLKDIRKNVPDDTALLTVSPKEEAQGFKHVFLTEPDKTTIGGRIRSPLGMWADDEIYINNDVFHVLKRLIDYYADE